jgi:hypothetical protein
MSTESIKSMIRTTVEGKKAIETVLCKKDLTDSEKKYLLLNYSDRLKSLLRGLDELEEEINQKKNGETTPSLLHKISILKTTVFEIKKDIKNAIELIDLGFQDFQSGLEHVSFKNYSLEELKKELIRNPNGSMCSFEITSNGKSENIIGLIIFYLEAKITKIKDLYIFHTPKSILEVSEQLSTIFNLGLITELRGTTLSSLEAHKFPQSVLELRSIEIPEENTKGPHAS